jgi:hypothetical protein
VRDGNFLMHMISSFLNDRLWISFTYAPAFLSTATAGGLVDRLLDDLEIEGAVDRADGYHALARQIGLLEETAAPTPPPGA